MIFFLTVEVTVDLVVLLMYYGFRFEINIKRIKNIALVIKRFSFTFKKFAVLRHGELQFKN